MYDFIYYFFHRYYVKFNDPVPDFRSVGAVVVTQVSHLFFLTAIMGYLGFDFPIVTHEGTFEKYYIIPLLILWFFLVNRYYDKEHIQKIMDKHNPDQTFFTLQNILYFILIFVVPTALGIILIKAEQHTL